MSTLELFSLKAKQGFITGAARGIGKRIAEAYADLGADIAIVEVDMAEAEKTAAEIAEKYGVKCIAIECDVTSEQSVEAMIAKYESEFERIDFAVNNAGIANVIPAEEISAAEFKKVVDVNLNGVFMTAQAAGKLMIKRGTKGSIINTASMSGHIINRPQTIANYCASKGGVILLTKALAVEWAKYGIRVNCVSPGYIGTELVAAMKDMHPIWLKDIPADRLGTPDDLVGAYVYFATAASRYATGSDLAVDGGYTSI
ncbi:MAG: SDR family oxidoreductase [Rikenellaceae bacterium]